MRIAQICSSDFQGIKEAKRDLIVTAKAIFLIGREPVKSGPNKGQMVESISRRISFHELNQVSGHFLRKYRVSKRNFPLCKIAQKYSFVKSNPFYPFIY